MKHAEIDGGKSAAFQKRDRQRIAERELHQRRSGRRQIMRAGLARRRQDEHDIGRLAQRALGIDGDGDQRDAEAARIVDQIPELFGLARPGQHQHHVVGRDHAEVAVAGVAGMHEKRRRAGRGQRRRDLAPDVTRLADAGHDHAAARGANRIDGGDEARPQSVAHRRRQRAEPVAFGIERAQCRSDEAVRLALARPRVGRAPLCACAHRPYPNTNSIHDTAERPVSSYFFSQAAKASLKAWSPGGPFSIARMARPPLV